MCFQERKKWIWRSSKRLYRSIHTNRLAEFSWHCVTHVANQNYVFYTVFSGSMSSLSVHYIQSSLCWLFVTSCIIVRCALLFLSVVLLSHLWIGSVIILGDEWKHHLLINRQRSWTLCPAKSVASVEISNTSPINVSHFFHLEHAEHTDLWRRVASLKALFEKFLLTFWLFQCENFGFHAWHLWLLDDSLSSLKES